MAFSTAVFCVFYGLSLVIYSGAGWYQGKRPGRQMKENPQYSYNSKLTVIVNLSV